MSKDYVGTVVWTLVIILFAGCGSSATTTPVLPTTTSVPPAEAPATDAAANASAPAAISSETVEQVECLQILSGHSDRVMTLDFSGDGTYLASSSMDGTIKLWDVQSGQVVHTFQKSVNEAIVHDITFGGCCGRLKKEKKDV